MVRHDGESASGYKYTKNGNKLEIVKDDFEKLTQEMFSLANLNGDSSLDMYFLQEKDSVTFVIEVQYYYYGSTITIAYYLYFTEA